jgi:FAD binding domain
MLDDRPMTASDPEYPWFGRFSDLMPKNWLDSVQQAIDLGGIKHSPTIEGLAAELGLDPGKLAEAVKTWNAKAAAGRPDEFGRLPQNIKPIKKAPFYGIKTGPLIAGIFCGPRVNHRLEVVGKVRQPLPGLYAAGLTAGGTNGEGIFNATVLSNLGLAFSTGWIAGDNATAATPAYQPAGMIIESEVGAQRILNKLNRHYPRLGEFVLKTGFRLTAIRQRIRKHNWTPRPRERPHP